MIIKFIEKYKKVVTKCCKGCYIFESKDKDLYNDYDCSLYQLYRYVPTYITLSEFLHIIKFCPCSKCIIKVLCYNNSPVCYQWITYYQTEITSRKEKIKNLISKEKD